MTTDVEATPYSFASDMDSVPRPELQMRFARFHVIALVLIGGLAQAYAETPSEYRHRIAKADADMNLEEHSINMARKDKKLTREQAIEQMKAVIDKNKEAHKQL